MRIHEFVETTGVTEITKSTMVSRDQVTARSLSDERDGAIPTKINIKGYPVYWDEQGGALLVKDPSADQFLGVLHLEPLGKVGAVSSVFFARELQGKGIAVPLYTAAIKQLGYTIVSDYEQSTGSQSLWARLSKVPGIFVYGWNPDTANTDNEFFQWDPDTDPDEEIYYDPDEPQRIQDEFSARKDEIVRQMKSGEIEADDAQDAMMQQAAEAKRQLADLDSMRFGDIRLVATTKKGLD